MPSFENPTNGPSAFGPAVRAAPGDSAGSHVEYHYWRAIDDSLLQEGRGAVPEFPVARLPQPWRDWVADTARSVGAPADYVAQAVLGAVAGVCGAGVLARVTPSWSEPLVLWQALLGGPSSGKSPALAAVRRLLDPIDDALRREDDKRRGRHAARVEQARLRSERWQAECLQAAETGAVPPPMPPDGGIDRDFVPARIVVDASSVAALGDAVSANPRGVILWRDASPVWPQELDRPTGGRNADRSDRASWLAAWSAGEVGLKRRSHDGRSGRRGLRSASSARSIPSDWPSRCRAATTRWRRVLLYSWPHPPPYCRLKDRRPPPDGEAFEMLRRIAGAAGTPHEPLLLHCDEGALESLDDFLAGLHAEIAKAEGMEAGWLGKGGGTVVRLAAALALLAWSGAASIDGPPGHIGRQQVEDAVALWAGYFKPHARAVFNQRRRRAMASGGRGAWCAGWRTAEGLRYRARRSGARRWATRSIRSRPTA